MPRRPAVVGLVLCERWAIDPTNGQMSLVGIFHTLRVPRFPTPPRGFTAYAALYGGVGEGTMELVVTRLETEQDIYRYRRWFAFPRGVQLINLEIKVRKCRFPAPGRYAVSLRFDGQELTYRYLSVFPTEE
jgi:hypothetical protein